MPSRVFRSLAWATVILVLVPTMLVSMAAQQGPVQLPPQAAVQLEGELEVMYEDSEDGARLLHYLKTSSGELRLEIPGDPPGLQSGTRVRVRGNLKSADTLELASSSDLVALALANSNTFGEQRTIVILVNFQDKQTMPYTATHAQAMTFQTASDFFYANSFEQTWLSGDVYGWFTLPMSSAVCDKNQIASLAEQAAADAGANLSSYSRKIYAFPSMSCGWWGLGSVGGNPSRAWINGSYALKVVAHELGHNFGDYHSRSMPCSVGGCSVNEYGDDADVMGNPTSGHLNAFQKERLGWLNYEDAPPIQSVGQSGGYWVEGYDTLTYSGSPKALRILKEIDQSGNRTWYYVEARTGTGFDAGIGPAVILHTGSEATGNSSYQIDLAPMTSSFDSRLDVGQVFEDAAVGVSITTLSVDSTGAWVDVSFDTAPCVEWAPTVQLTGGPASAAAGESVDYTVRVTNQDDPTCGSAAFDLAAAVPSGWSAGFGATSLTVAPGSTSMTDLAVTSSAEASGSYEIRVDAVRAGPTASGSTTIDVSAVVTNLEASLSITEGRRGFDLVAAVTSDGQAVAGASVTFVVTKPDGKSMAKVATTNGSGTAKWTFRPKRKDPTGTYTVTAAASVNGASASAAGSFVVK